MKLARLSFISLAVALFAILAFAAPNEARSATYVTPSYTEASTTYVHYYPRRRYYRPYYRHYYRPYRYYSYPYYSYYPYYYYPYPYVWPGFSFYFRF